MENRETKGKKEYKKPIIETEDVIERVALGCGKASNDGSGSGRPAQIACNGGMINS